MNAVDLFNDVCHEMNTLDRVHQALEKLDVPENILDALDDVVSLLSQHTSTLEDLLPEEEDWGDECLTASQRNSFMH